MEFVCDEALLRHLSWRACTGSANGRRGLVAALVLLALSPVVGLLVRDWAARSLAGRLREGSGALGVFGLAGALVPLAAALFVLVLTWVGCNRFVGGLTDQEALVSRGYLTYVFRVRGDPNKRGRNVVEVRLDPSATTMSFDARTGVITLVGAVHQDFVGNYATYELPAYADMPPVGKVYIANCYQPDLHEALLAYLPEG